MNEFRTRAAVICKEPGTEAFLNHLTDSIYHSAMQGFEEWEYGACCYTEAEIDSCLSLLDWYAYVGL